VLDVPVAEVILNEPRIRALIGQRETASVAEHMGMRENGQGGNSAVFSEGQVDRRTVQGFRCSLTKNTVPVGFIRARSFSHAPMARSSSPRNGCVVDNPPFNLATCNTRLSMST
jgi:hypothetical protein